MGVILVAYEREAEQTAVEQLLSGRGHSVVRAANGLAALDAARREPPHVVVSDIVLPRMDGFALCRKWKQDERLQSIPFVFYTRRHDDPKYERFALELGAERFLARTEQPDALLQAIDELLANAPKNATAKMPVLDEAAVQRTQTQAQTLAAERAKAQALAVEQAQQAQARLRSQVAELESTNQRLAAGEARFRRIFEANPLPMWIADRATGGFIAVNEAALALYGYGRAEFLALKSAALAAPDGAAGKKTGDTTGDTTDDTSIVTHRRKDGARIEVSLASHEIEFDGREADLVSLSDQTGRVAAESRLHHDAAASRAAADAANRELDASRTVIDAANRELDANRAMIDAANREREASRVTIDAATRELDASRTAADAANRELDAQRSGQSQLEFLVDLFRQADAFDESAIVRRVIEQAAAATHSPLAYLFFVNPANKTMTLAAWRERSQAQATMANSEPRALAKAGLFTECVRAKHPTSGNDLSWKPQPDGLPDLQRYVAVPMIADDETVAVLGVANRDAGYGEADQRALASLSDGVWRVLQAKRAHAQTLSSLQRTDVALQGMIDALLRLSEKHDPYTAGSARRVAALAVALGREAGLDGERQHALRVAALLHDVGNVAVPPSVLAKPGRLSGVETALMRTHVEEGCKLLADIDFGAPIAEIVFEHHERCDGSGYPRGLKGEEIMLEARILAIADVVEAICSPRPYRAALGMDAAIDEINRGAGVTYDLHLATACTRLVRQHGFGLPE